MLRKLTIKMKDGVLVPKTTSTASLGASTRTLTEKPYKIILLGDSRCGKSSLLRRYTKRNFTEDYIPTVFDSGSADVVAEQNNDVKLNIWDTSGSSEFDHIRPLSFGEASVFIICYDMEKPTASLENIHKKWLKEVKSQHPDTPIIVVGCKLDLKSDVIESTKKNTIFCQQGMSLAKQIGAVGYIECSSKNDDNVTKIDKLFKTTALLSIGQLNKVPKEIRPRDPKSTKPDPKCSIM